MTVAIVSCEMGDGSRRQRCGREFSDDDLILEGEESNARGLDETADDNPGRAGHGGTDDSCIQGGSNRCQSLPGRRSTGWKSSIDVAGAVGPQHVVDFDVADFCGA